MRRAKEQSDNFTFLVDKSKNRNTYLVGTLTLVKYIPLLIVIGIGIRHSFLEGASRVGMRSS